MCEHKLTQARTKFINTYSLNARVCNEFAHLKGRLMQKRAVFFRACLSSCRLQLTCSNLLNVGAQDNVNNERVRVAGLDEATLQFAFPNRLNPLADASQRINVF